MWTYKKIPKQAIWRTTDIIYSIKCSTYYNISTNTGQEEII